MIDPKNLPGTAQLVFADEFDTLKLWNGVSGWETKYPHSSEQGSTLEGNGEQEVYVNHAYGPTSAIRPWEVSNGILSLVADRAPYPLAIPQGTYGYASGLITSYRWFNQTYGYFEMRAKLPKGRGLWPAFWLLPANATWPPEIDAMEVLGHDLLSLYTNVHTNQTGTHTSSGKQTQVEDMSLAFHTYGVDWRKETIRWFFDGAPVFEAPTPADLHQPMYIIANLAVGGYWPGMVDASTPFPARMEIDYIRAYKEAAAAAPVPAPAPAPTRPPRVRRPPRRTRTR